MAKKVTDEEWIKRFRSVHGDKYNYDKCVFTYAKTKVEIYCKKCDIFFWQSPDNHFGKKKNCPKCMNKLLLSKGEWVKKFKSVHGDKYGYEDSIIKKSTDKIEIYCKKCNKLFSQSRASHYNQGHGCPRCAGQAVLTDEEWVERFISIHGNKYDYSKCKFKTAIEKIEIYCRGCNKIFWQNTGNHYYQKCGCPRCAGTATLPYKEWVERFESVHGDKYCYKESVRCSSMILIKNNKK